MALTPIRRWFNAMATQKHLKLKEDEHRLMLENGIKTLLASQAKVLAAVERLIAQSEKEMTRVKKPQTRK